MDPNQHKTVEDIQNQLTPTPSTDDIEIEIDDDFDYSQYAVVRGEFFSHLREPSIAFADQQFSANAACVKKLPNTDYVQILINPESKKILVRAAQEDEKDSFMWVTYRKKDGKRSPKKVTCKIFSAKLFDTMGWNPESRYKLLGKMVQSKGELFFSFDLSEPEVFQREVSGEGEKPKRSRVPQYVEEWKNQFGIPYEEHQKLQVTTFDGYAVFSLSDKQAQQEDPSAEQPAAEPATQETASQRTGGVANVFRTI